MLPEPLSPNHLSANEPIAVHNHITLSANDFDKVALVIFKGEINDVIKELRKDLLPLQEYKSLQSQLETEKENFFTNHPVIVQALTLLNNLVEEPLQFHYFDTETGFTTFEHVKPQESHVRYNEGRNRSFVVLKLLNSENIGKEWEQIYKAKEEHSKLNAHNANTYRITKLEKLSTGNDLETLISARVAQLLMEGSLTPKTFSDKIKEEAKTFLSNYEG